MAWFCLEDVVLLFVLGHGWLAGWLLGTQRLARMSSFVCVCIICHGWKLRTLLARSFACVTGVAAKFEGDDTYQAGLCGSFLSAAASTLQETNPMSRLIWALNAVVLNEYISDNCLCTTTS